MWVDGNIIKVGEARCFILYGVGVGALIDVVSNSDSNVDS